MLRGGQVGRPSRIDSRSGLRRIEQQANALGFHQRTDHGFRAGLSIDPAVPIGIIGQERVKEPVHRGPERIMEVGAHLVSHLLGETDSGEKMDMGQRPAQLPVRQRSKDPHGPCSLATGLICPRRFYQKWSTGICGLTDKG